jgi:hypothetical protein
MGLFPTNDTIITRAKTFVPSNVVDPLSFWEFENQSGTLGTNLTGSVVYVGTAGNVTGILSGTVGDQGVVLEVEVVNPGAAYTTAFGLPTVLIEGKSVALNPSGLFVSIIADGGGGITNVDIGGGAGQQYSVGDIVEIVQGAAKGGTARVVSVRNNLPNPLFDVVKFQNVAAGTVLPVLFDYIVADTTATDLIVGK